MPTTHTNALVGHNKHKSRSISDNAFAFSENAKLDATTGTCGRVCCEMCDGFGNCNPSPNSRYESGRNTLLHTAQREL